MKKSGWIAVFVLVLGAAESGAERINAILATVDGEPITLYEVRQFEKTNIRARQAPPASLAESLQAVITEKILEQEVKQKGIIVRDQDVDAYIEQVKSRNRLDDRGLAEALRQQGLTLDDYRKQVRRDLARQQLIAREIRGKVSVTPEDVERYLKEHQEETKSAARTRVAHIFFRLPAGADAAQRAAVLAKAESVREEIRAGLDFSAAAARYSEDASARSGGDLGWFKPGEMLDELEEVARRLPEGEVSEPIVTRSGVHLLRVLAREEGGKGNRSALEEEVRQKLYNQALEERFQRWINEDLYKQHHVEILD